MKTREIEQQKAALELLINRTSQATAGDLEMQAHWARYLCVLSAGLLENAITAIYSRYSASCANPKVANFTRQKLSLIQNPKAGRFLEVAESFDKTWSQNLEAFLEIEGRKEAINSIMTNRHQIAHGKQSDISLARIKDYLKKAIVVLEYIEDQCGLSQE